MGSSPYRAAHSKTVLDNKETIFHRTSKISLKCRGSYNRYKSRDNKTWSMYLKMAFSSIILWIAPLHRVEEHRRSQGNLAIKMSIREAAASISIRLKALSTWRMIIFKETTWCAILSNQTARAYTRLTIWIHLRTWIHTSWCNSIIR